jgi:hypothetical protein
MKILLDTNIALDVLLDRQPFRASANFRFDADAVSIHLRHPFHPRNLRFPGNCSF